MGGVRILGCALPWIIYIYSQVCLNVLEYSETINQNGVLVDYINRFDSFKKSEKLKLYLT